MTFFVVRTYRLLLVCQRSCTISQLSRVWIRWPQFLNSRAPETQELLYEVGKKQRLCLVVFGPGPLQLSNLRWNRIGSFDTTVCRAGDFCLLCRQVGAGFWSCLLFLRI